jgi:CheY-like chemotaxis protein
VAQYLPKPCGAITTQDFVTAPAVTSFRRKPESTAPHIGIPKNLKQSEPSAMMKTVLVVDDEVNFVRSLSAGLARQDIRVLTAANGKEAVDVLRSVNVDVLLTDLRMPEMDGFELVAHVERRHPEVPVIVMTAFGTPEIFDRVRGMGTLYYIEKPLDLDRLVKMISDAYSMRVQGRVKGISLAAFIQLIDLEQKTCTLHVTSGNKNGALYCLRGRIVDAETDDLRGLPAVYEMLLWNEVAIEINNACARTEPTIDAPSDLICLEGARLRDEAARAIEEPSGEAQHSFLCDSSVFEGLFAEETAPAIEDSAPEPPSPRNEEEGGVSDARPPLAAPAEVVEPEVAPATIESPEEAPSTDESISPEPLPSASVNPEELERLRSEQAAFLSELEGLVSAVVLDAQHGVPVVALSRTPEFDMSRVCGLFKEIFAAAADAYAVSSWGGVNEVIMPGEHYTILMRSLGEGRFRQALAVTSDTPLGMVRAVLKKHAAS